MPKKLKFPKVNLAPPLEVDGVRLVETTIRHRDGGMTVLVALFEGGKKVGERPIDIGGDFDFADDDILKVVKDCGIFKSAEIEED